MSVLYMEDLWMYKFIYWRDDIARNKKGERWANIHVIGYRNQGVTFADLETMMAELQETFPQVPTDMILVQKIQKSPSSPDILGWTLLECAVYLPLRKRYPESWVKKRGGMNYDW